MGFVCMRKVILILGFGIILQAFFFVTYQHSYIIGSIHIENSTVVIPLPSSTSSWGVQDFLSMRRVDGDYHTNDAESNVYETRFRTKTMTTSNTTTTTISTSTMRSITGFFDETIREFERQEGVVIATKIHGPEYLRMLTQMLCLLHQAYNSRLQYDIIVFTTEPIDPSQVLHITQMVAPVHIQFVHDNKGLQEEIAALSPERRQQFIKDCRLQSEMELVNLTWYSDCLGRIAYNHQAEFRSWHIWNHPSVIDYHYMMWLDADAFCSQRWTRDPVAIAMQHNLTILFDNFPQGDTISREVHARIQKAMNGSLCNVKLTPEGYFQRSINEDCYAKGGTRIPLIHGFFHITNMDFYRRHIYWAEVLIGNGFLQRRFDDQVAVTIPAAYYTPNQSFLLRKVGIDLAVFHNGRIDGNMKVKGGGFLAFWHKNGGKEQFPDGHKNCAVTSKG